MARTVLVLLLAVAVTLVAADFSLKTFESKFQKGTKWQKSSVAHVKPYVAKINALPREQRDRLTDCLYSAALNSLDEDSSERGMFGEVGGCLSAFTDTSKDTTAITSSLLASV